MIRNSSICVTSSWPHLVAIQHDQFVGATDLKQDIKANLRGLSYGG